MPEVRNALEGNLYWIPASGLGTSWVTASGASGVLMGYVRDFTYTSAQDIQQVSDRGVPKMHKKVAVSPINVTFTVAYGITAQYPPVGTTGDGTTVKLINLELKQNAQEIGSGSGIFTQVYGVSINSRQFTEGTPENTYQVQGVGLGILEYTASGYIG